MERKTPLANVSSTQRLSLMIDSLHDVQSNDELLGINTVKSQPSDDSLGGPPNTKSFMQPPSTAGSFSPYQGSSLSEYSGVVNNATEMVRVTNDQVTNVHPLNIKNTVSNLQLNQNETRTTSSSSSESDYNKKPLLPNFPTENDLRKTSYASRLPTFVTERSDTPVETLTSTPDKSVSTSQESHTNKSIPSHLNLEIDRDKDNINDEDEDVEQTERELIALNISAPAYSHNRETSINDIDNTDIIEVSDHSSINSSIAESLPPPLSPHEDKILMTTTEQLKNESNSGSSGSPSVPPRSKDRPRANRIPTEKRLIEAQESKKLSTYNPQNRDSITSIPSTTNKSESYYSAASFVPEEQENNEEQRMINDPSHFLAMNKTVPMIYPPHNRQSHDDMFGSTPSKIHTVDLDNIYEDIHPATLPPKDMPSNIIQVEPKAKENVNPEKKRKGDKHKKKKKSKELRQFDADTINQLLNVTQGTLIGSEFSNLGMKIEEKRLLERLVDSLSRLSADMVLDQNRYEEGLRRLNKATKALEGFEEK